MGLAAAVLIALAICFSVSLAQASMVDDSPRVQIWTDRGSGGVYRVGDRAGIHFRPEDDCYVIIYEIDTEGYLRVLFPDQCSDDGYVVGGRNYSIGKGGYQTFYVNGPSGVEYVHVVASYEPFRQIYWHGCDGYSAYAGDVTWQGFHDYWGSALPPRVYGDPYSAMQTIDEFICTDGLEAGLVSADFTYFYVGERVHYPRYLCYDCHGFSPDFRPYADVCVAFSISLVECDPCYRPSSWWWWCTPARAYCGPRYVCHGKEYWCNEHNCDSHDCRGQHKTYPSEYKWKSRMETHGTSVPGIVRATMTKPGNIVDAVRVKSREENRDRDLYARSGSRERSTERESKVNELRNELRERESGTRETRANEAVKSEPRGDIAKMIAKVPKSESTIKADRGGKSILSSVVRRLTKSVGNSAKHTPKGIKPQVRGVDKGKSTAARRNLSR